MATGRLIRKKTLAQAIALVGVLVLAGALVAGCGSTISPRAGSDEASGSLVNIIVVSGTGWTTSLPDKATIQVSVENDGATSAAALDANSKDTKKVLDRLKAEGVAESAIETANVVVYPNRYYDSTSGQEKTTGYRAQNTITVTFTDFELMADVFAAVTEAGADSVYGPSWQLSEDNPAVLTALSKAVENARIKAEALAETQGVTLGKAIVITEGSVSMPSPIYRDKMETSAGAGDAAVTPPPLSPENIEVSASVSVTYPMQR
ncbi:MAG: SIMPL domain-containing protein [Thermoleophilia bacterium]|nr:SIMPL domain-containing protein [Thermoleophilia bacterium]